METLLKDIRYGVRGLLNHPGFAAIAVITLALGIGANTAIFSVLYAVLLHPLPYPEPDRIVRIDETEGRGGMGVSPPNFLDFRQQNHAFEFIAAYSGGSFILTGGDEPLRVEGAVVSSELFALLKVNPLLGRPLSKADEENNQKQIAVVGYGLWQRRFGGDRGLVGRQITLDSKNYQVVGIMPPEFEFPIQNERVEVWVPLILPDDVSQLRGAHYLDLVGRLRPNISLAAAHADLDVIASGISGQFPKLVSGQTLVVPLKEDVLGDVQPYLLILAGAAALVLLIATANVASLMLARAAQRQKEIALRLALGASRFRLLRQLLAESLTLSLVGGVSGILLAMWCTDLLIAIAPPDLPRLHNAHLNIPVLSFGLIVSVLSGMLFGLAPALGTGVPDLHTTLKEGEGRTAIAPRQRLRKVLVISEVSLALVLLCGAGLLIKTLWNLNAVPPGFDPERVLVAEIVLPTSRYTDESRQAAFFSELLERLRSLPGVESVGGTTNLPLSGTNMVFMAAVAGSSNGQFPASFRAVTPGYFRAMSIPLLKGREIDARDTASSASVVVVSQSMARRISEDGEVLGRRIKHGFKNQTAEVIGVVGDVKYAGLDVEAKPEVYAPFAQRVWPFMRVTVRAKTNPLSLVGAIRRQVGGIDKDQPVDKITTMRSVVKASIAPQLFYMELLGSFAGLASVLAAIGIYGVVSYSVTQRTRELGIRIALGAQRGDVLRLLLAEGVKLAGIGVILGLAGAVAATRVLRKLLFAVTATDPITFMAFSLLLGGIALLACYIPARRATRVDPLVALRYE